MKYNNGSLVLLKIKNDKIYEVIGGMKTTRFTIHNQTIDASNKDSGSWRALLEGAGLSYMNISGNGVFTDSNAEYILRKAAFSNQAQKFKITYPNGDFIKGMFHISNYERSGNFNEEELYAITLESSGQIEYFSNKDKLLN